MKKNSILMVLFCTNFLIISCSQSNDESRRNDELSEQKEVKLNHDTDIKKRVESLTMSSVKDSAMKNTKEPIRTNKKTLFFNGEKYLFSGGKLKKGSEVRSISSSEKASIRGTFVVVSKIENITNVSIKNKLKIAKDTYRLTPSKTDDLMAVYKELMLNDSITKVELELVYSGKRNNAAEY
ncbi:hypothetical protein [Colwellia sp. 20A7]|uniref:hypothetical protein n=1 Tax=Colwellia sp. 20A7 TaxID=2689569 RepID=UPI00135BED30|nr:hypothetical protein [Colwellia sp. 20A7]